MSRQYVDALRDEVRLMGLCLDLYDANQALFNMGPTSLYTNSSGYGTTSQNARTAFETLFNQAVAILNSDDDNFIRALKVTPTFTTKRKAFAQQVIWLANLADLDDRARCAELFKTLTQ